MERRAFLITAGAAIGASSLLGAGCSTTTTRPDAPVDREAKKREIDSAADETLTRLYSTVRGSKELADRAQGILIAGAPAIQQASDVSHSWREPRRF